MSERLYYTDAYLSAFKASIVDRLQSAGGPAVVLDRTAFYPTSGGQPFDTGEIAGIRVVDVVDGEDGRVMHVLEREVDATGLVECRIDWDRRFDHMQQHTGQHVLSAAFERVGGIRTESVHFGAASCTIDVSASVTPEIASAAEADANRVVCENRPVHVRFVTDAEAARLPLRKPPVREGRLRLVEVDGVDLSACGGTHVARTGEIGLIAVLGFERYKGGTRVEFACGRRAHAHYTRMRDTTASVARLLACAADDVVVATERLQNEVKQQRHVTRDLQQRLAELEGERLRGAAVPRDGLSVVAEHLADWDGQGLRNLAAAVTRDGSYVCILVGGTPINVVVARGPGARVDAAAVVRSLTGRFGGRGGGRSELAQAGGLVGEPVDVLEAAMAALGSGGFLT
jgi:alanyl-tRNA synthetase